MKILTRNFDDTFALSRSHQFFLPHYDWARNLNKILKIKIRHRRCNSMRGRRFESYPKKEWKRKECVGSSLGADPIWTDPMIILYSCSNCGPIILLPTYIKLVQTIFSKIFNGPSIVFHGISMEFQWSSTDFECIFIDLHNCSIEFQ